ncbi:MAG: hypothetical protein CFE27_00835 [Alphaproteobacteria bacterium PA1]|nr:MAG: hypothetical protein CFE27_00835 [Alphaproteobacteria bacterium PA1]
MSGEAGEGERATKVALVIALTGAARAARSFWWGFYLADNDPDGNTPSVSQRDAQALSPLPLGEGRG